MPDTVNGYPIIVSSRTPGDHATRPGRVILVHREGVAQPYVTAWLGDGDSSWCWGHYFDDDKTAHEDFVRRVAHDY